MRETYGFSSRFQEKRALLLGSRGPAGLQQGNNERPTEVSLELNSKRQDYSLPVPRYFTPVEKAQSDGNDVTHHLVKPSPRHVGVVRPVQFPDRKICHPVPQAMRRPRGGSPADITDSCRLPLKKRPYIPTQEDVGSSSTKVGRLAIIDYSERSAFYKYIPARVMDDYLRYLRHTEVGMTTEDREMAGNTNSNAVQNKLSENPSDMNSNFIQQISPVILCQSPEHSQFNQSSLETFSATVRSSSSSSSRESTGQENPAYSEPHADVTSPVILCQSPEHRHFNQSSLETISATVRSSSSSTESTGQENLAYSEPHADVTSHHNIFPGSETDSPGKKKPSMEELRRMVLDKSADRPGLDRFTQTEEEQFAEILEDFLEENKDLPPEIRDNILVMLTKTRETVAEQKEGILYTAEICKGESDDKPYMDEFDRAADDGDMELFSELELPDLQTEVPDLPTIITCESTKDMETNMEEFDRAADEEVMDLINEIELPDLLAAETSKSPNDVLLDMETNMRTSRTEPTIGTLYSTDVFIGADDERLLAEFERVVNDELIFEDTKIAELPGPSAYDINESSKAKFKSVSCVEVEMNSTGQEIYDEIAAFFGYDGYHDYLSYDNSEADVLPDLPFEYSADIERPDKAIDELTNEYSADEESDSDDFLFE